MPRLSKGPRASATVFRPLLGALVLSALALAPLAAAAEDIPDEPFGRLVSVGEHRLHLHCLGAGAPAVILEAGIGGNHLDWIRVQPDIAAFTRACSYDRAGYGWSERGPKPRSVARIADELATLLNKAGVAGPVVLAGHSFGGLASLAFAVRFPERVAGLVLLDSMHPEQYERFAENGIDVPTEPTRAVIYSGREVLAYGIPPPYEKLAYRLASGDKVRSYLFNELRTVAASMEFLRAAAPPGVPARVVVHGNRQWDRIYPDGRMERVWLALQQDLAARLGAPAPLVATDSGHHIPLDDPATVIAVVRELVVSLRGEPSGEAPGASGPVPE